MALLTAERETFMSRHRIGFAMRNIVVVLLMSAMAAGLTACPEKTGEAPAHDGPDNHAPADHMGGGMMGGM
jgi:hypothetical protein